MRLICAGEPIKYYQYSNDYSVNLDIL